MIYTITLNPSLDCVSSLRTLTQGDINRVEGQNIYVGGKGVNVSRILTELEVDNTALGIIAGFTGDEIERQLRADGIATRFKRLDNGMSRINTKLLHEDGTQTELNGEGPLVDVNDVYSLIDNVKLGTGDMVVLSGSIPKGIDNNIYRQIIQRLEDKNVLVVVDATRSLLVKTLSYRPFLVKPNKQELGELFKVKLETREDIIYYGQSLKSMGAVNVLVSMGDEGAILIADDDNIYEAEAPQGKVINAVGAGDSMLAGFIAGYMQNADYEEAFRYAVAAGSATAFARDLAEAEDIYRLIDSVEVKERISAVEENVVSRDMYTVEVTRPIGTSHPDYPSIVYALNYGYVEGVNAEDGEPQGAYIIGLDNPTDRFTGKKIAIIHRHELDADKWVIAPENMPYNKSQIEEMVMFAEEFRLSSIEMIDEEMWDAYDASENKLGYEIPRSMAKNLEDGVYHIAVLVYVVRSDGAILTTQRSRNKTNALKWEVSGGSILAGEEPREGAVRELREETGIYVDEDELKELYHFTDDTKHVIYYGFRVDVPLCTKVHLQIGETMDYDFLKIEDFVELVDSDRFLPSERRRFNRFRDDLLSKLK